MGKLRNNISLREKVLVFKQINTVAKLPQSGWMITFGYKFKVQMCVGRMNRKWILYDLLLLLLNEPTFKIQFYFYKNKITSL